jgi:hypothetical protein
MKTDITPFESKNSYIGNFFSVGYDSMCAKATEIQELWKPKVGDFAKHPKKNNDEFGCVTSDFDMFDKHEVEFYAGYASQSTRDYQYRNVESFKKDECVWLPRQDQLQKMIVGSLTNDDLVVIFVRLSARFISTNQPISWCECWLEVVMERLYNKKWNSESNQWIEITK